MIDLLFRIVLSNVCVSLALAVLAIIVQKTLKRPSVAYLLWLMVFVKLVSPPLVTIPVFTIEGNVLSYSEQILANSVEIAANEQPQASPVSGFGALLLDRGKTWFMLFWLVGSVFALAWSLFQVCRFSRLLDMESKTAPRDLQSSAANIAKRLGLKKIPAIQVTSAQISPMVWWIGGKVRVVIPEDLIDQMDARQLGWILAHEMAHVRRRDYLIRWIEWMACVFFWWNPVVWWARRNLRINEELCCDALVVSSLKPKPHTYADSLLNAVECLACPVHRPPAMASEIGSGGLLERRFKMIITQNPNGSKSRRLEACVLLVALLVLPLGLAVSRGCDDGIKLRLEKTWEDLQAKVEAGELTQEQAESKMKAIKKDMQAGLEARKKYEYAEKEIRAAIEAGEITGEQGREKLADLKEQLGREHDWSRIKRRIEAAVKRGDMTREQADAKYDEIKKQTASRHKKEINMDDFMAQIEKAVEKGELSKKEAQAKIEWYKKRMETAVERERIEAFVDSSRKKLHLAVENGEMTEEEAGKRASRLEKEAQMKIEAMERHHEQEEIEEYLQQLSIKLQKAVEEGEMTKEEADKNLEQLKKEASEKISQHHAHHD